jgi:hypothetical protein
MGCCSGWGSVRDSVLPVCDRRLNSRDHKRHRELRSVPVNVVPLTSDLVSDLLEGILDCFVALPKAPEPSVSNRQAESRKAYDFASHINYDCGISPADVHCRHVYAILTLLGRAVSARNDGRKSHIRIGHSVEG